MITRKQADQAKEKLVEQLGQPAWLTGVALGLGGSGVSIRVAIDGEVTDAIRALVPASVDGVEVILESAIVSVPFDRRWLK